MERQERGCTDCCFLGGNQDIDHRPATDPSEPRVFDNVISGLKRSYPREKMEEISTSFCFICLLHLANERGLKLETGVDEDGGLTEVDEEELEQRKVGNIWDLKVSFALMAHFGLCLPRRWLIFGSVGLQRSRGDSSSMTISKAVHHFLTYRYLLSSLYLSLFPLRTMMNLRYLFPMSAIVLILHYCIMYSCRHQWTILSYTRS